MDYKLKLKQITNDSDIVKLSDDAVGFALALALRESKEQLFLLVTSDDVRMYDLEQQMGFFAPEIQVLTMPAWDCLPYDRVSPKADIVSKRVRALSVLAKNSSQKTLVIATINSVLQKTIPHNFIRNLGFGIAVNDEIKIDDLTNYLVNSGYSRSPVANSVGEFAVRGSIVDIIIPSSYQKEDDLIGYRLDFFGDALEEIRVFDPITQVTSNKINKINFLPTSEVILGAQNIDNFRKNYRQTFGAANSDMMYNAITSGRHYPGMEHWLSLFYDEKLSSIFEYVKNAVHFVEEKALNLIDDRIAAINEYYLARVETLKESVNSGSAYNPLPPEDLYLSKKELENYLEKSGKFLVKFNNFSASSEEKWTPQQVRGDGGGVWGKGDGGGVWGNNGEVEPDVVTPHPTTVTPHLLRGPSFANLNSNSRIRILLQIIKRILNNIKEHINRQSLITLKFKILRDFLLKNHPLFFIF